MKIKGLLLGMLACAAMVACTDNDIVENDGANPEVQKANAYITLSINSATNSSRATTGDTDGNSETSGHENAGTAAESTVNDVLIIVKGTADGFVKYYTVDQLDDDYSMPEPYKLSATGIYSALVVVNPEAKLETDIRGLGEKGYNDAYDKVLNYKLSDNTTASRTTNDAAVANVIGTSAAPSFMMANRAEAFVEVNNGHNNPNTPASLEVLVERVISKITFRPVNNNVYPVTISHTTYAPVVETGFFQRASNSNMAYAKFNSANNGAFWFLSDVDDGGYYTKTNSEWTNTPIPGGFPQDGSKTLFEKMATQPDPKDVIFDRGQGTVSNTEKLYVKLEKYAMTNLSNDIYAVRHIAKTGFAESKSLGALAGDFKYIVDPNSAAKNATTLNNITIGNWFFNKLADVSADAANQTFTMFKDLPASVTDGAQSTDTPHSDEQVGQFLTYCFENAVVADHQVAGLVTGIIFRGQIYTDEACTNPVSVLYKYKGSYYKELRSLLDANSGDSALSGLTENSTDDEAEAVSGLEVYKGGKCFYYSGEIKHFDNNAESLGEMEFAIMRNNIYSLKIGTISSIGSATITPDAGGSVDDPMRYIKISARILPWVVRFNTVNF